MYRTRHAMKRSQPELSRAPVRADLLQRKGEGRFDAVPPIVHDVLHSHGKPLETSTRAVMEQRFGHDFSRVRVHDDRRAADSARAINARAYSVGSQIVFGEGQYAPGLSAGRHLLAHELTHVVQQGPAANVPTEIAPENDTSEREADTVATSVTSESKSVTPLQRFTPQTRLMRAPDDPTEKAHYPTEEERKGLRPIYKPEQTEAEESGKTQPDPVTKPGEFRTEMKDCMNDVITDVLPRAQARQASSVSLGLPEIQSLADVAQREVNRFFKPYLKAAVHSPAEQKRLASFKLRDEIKLVSSEHSKAPLIACNWVVSRMGARCRSKLTDFNVLANTNKAKESCSPAAASTTAATSTTPAPTPANERDQALFESVRDEVLHARQADVETIVKFQASFEKGGESFIQEKIAPEKGDTGNMTMRRGRWEAFGTTIHEMLHAVAHERFNEAVHGIEDPAIGGEGFAEYFTRIVYNDVKSRAEKDHALRTSIEGVNEPFDSSLVPERSGSTYDEYVKTVEKIKTEVAGNEESLRVAFFMGRVEFIGLGGWNAADAERHEALKHPANTIGFAAMMTSDPRGMFTIDYTRLVFGRGKQFQIGLGTDIYYLMPGERKEADVTVPESGRLGVAGKAMLQYQWPNFYIRGSFGVGASTGFDRPFEQSVRLDLIPGAEMGVRVGWGRIGMGTQILIPVVGGPIGEKTVKAGGMLGVKAEF